MIGESGKGDADQAIGHKGVGLKSILATGDAFEIWTRHPDAVADIFRVRLSRAYVVASILSRLGYQVDTDRLRGTILDRDLESLIEHSKPDSQLELTQAVKENLAKVPLFDFPVALEPTASAHSQVSQRAKSLLSESSHAWPETTFRTAVFIEYTDDEWRSLLDEYDIPYPEDAEDVGNRPERIWQYLSREGGSDGLKAETIVQLGGITDLHLERVHESGEQEQEQWSISRTKTSPADDELAHETVRVDVLDETGEVRSQDSFDQFSFAAETPAATQVLLPHPEGNPSTEDLVREYPLYLYYPIEGTEKLNLPFCLHGRFKVETNRKDLSPNNLETNLEVLREGVRLLGKVAAETWTTEYSAAYPWSLLPPAPDEVGAANAQTDPLTWFRSELYTALRDQAKIPVEAGEGRRSARPQEALLHWNRDIIEGFVALRDLARPPTNTPAKQPTADLPTQEVLTAYLGFPTAWQERVETLLAVDSRETFTADLARDWAKHLAHWLSQAALEVDQPHIERPAVPVRDVFQGTVETIIGGPKDDDQRRALLSDVSTHLDGVYLLPCQRNEDSESENSTLLLTQIEPRTNTQRRRQGVIRNRSVIWDITTTDRETETPDVPHEKSSFTVYFFDADLEQDERVRRVLELAGREWGVRVYDGVPSYFRELLDTFRADDTIVNSLDFQFLARQIDKINPESTDLQMAEGQYLPLSYLKSAVQQSEGDYRQNLRRRLEIRESHLSLPKEDTVRHISETAIGDDWQRIRETAVGNEIDEWDAIESPSPTWPAPQTESWQAIGRTLDSNADERLAKTLSLLGASVLPGIRTIWMYGPGHPRMQSNPDWHPANWTEDFTEAPPAKTTALQETLSKVGSAYEEWLLSPENHPSTTAEHSSKCPVKTDGNTSDVNLASWVWLAAPEALTSLGDDFVELVRRHGEAFAESILKTGWTCSNGHQRSGYAWTKSQPTLLNWQLRQLPVWESMQTTRPDVEDRWGDDADRLAWTVLKTSSRGAQAARLFPYVDSNTREEFSEEALEALGVKSVAAFDGTEAEYHLQKLLEVFATDSLTAQANPTDLQIPRERLNDWNRAYTQLLAPLLRRLPDDTSEAFDQVQDWPFLTHLPLKQGGTWYAAPLSWIEENQDQLRYYDDQSPKPWERQAVRDNDYWVVPHPSEGPFSRLTDVLGVERVDASKLVFTEDDLDLSRDPSYLGGFRQELRDRRLVLIAAMEQTSEEQLEQRVRELNQAIDGLAEASHFPEDSLDQLSDPKSGLYAPTEGEEALVLNRGAFDGESPMLDGLAMGIALIAEQPTKVATFREALNTDLSVADLEDRWERRTFPIEAVRHVLGDQQERGLRERLTAVRDLLEQTGEALPFEVEGIIEEVTQDNEGSIDAFRQALANGDTSQLPGQDVQSFVTTVRDRMPDELDFVLAKLFGTRQASWQRLLADQALTNGQESMLIQWVVSHPEIRDADSLPESTRMQFQRMLAVYEAWQTTDSEFLDTISAWDTRTAELLDSEKPSWSDPIPDQLATGGSVPNRLFFYANRSLFFDLVVNPFLAQLSEELAADADGEIDVGVREYIERGEFPHTQTTKSAKAYQNESLQDIQNALSSGVDVSLGNIELSNNGVRASDAAAVSSAGSGSGGSSQFKGRGQQAEAFTLVSLLDDFADWIDSGPRGRLRQFKSAFKQLHQAQSGTSYKWHIDRVWEQDIDPILDGFDILDEESIANWRENIDQTTSLADLPFIRLCNVTMEQGPGFDVIDPFGPLDGNRTEQERPEFMPVEIKAVKGSQPPFSFRLTTNEYRRCKAFVDADIPYAIRLVDVPDVETADWMSQCAFVSETVLTTTEEVESLVDSTQFETLVKGGYMNFELG
ncbi:hypothetical protein LPA44_17170 [Halobacterium sp. KA-4]|nr:hypothetical protein [Halobacterium sp. KA-4]MCD2201596.1 hypothetical protein [Halobacterium sp. KA-4]